MTHRSVDGLNTVAAAGTNPPRRPSQLGDFTDGRSKAIKHHSDVKGGGGMSGVVTTRLVDNSLNGDDEKVRSHGSQIVRVVPSLFEGLKRCNRVRSTLTCVPLPCVGDNVLDYHSLSSTSAHP